MLLSRLRLALLFGLFLAALLLRSSPSGALTHRMRCVGRLRKRCLVSAGAPLLTLSLLTGPAESSRVRARAFPLRLSASAPGSGFDRHPPPPNNSFKPTPCRGVGRVLYATLAHVRRPATGRLNSGVRPVNKHYNILLVVLTVVMLCSGCAQKPIAECPRSLTEPPMPDLPESSDIYRGKLYATFIIQESGRTSNVAVDASDLRISGEKVNRQAVERYAIESLRTRQFSSRLEPCKMIFSAWVN